MQYPHAQAFCDRPKQDGVEWAWEDAGELPGPDAFAALKLDVAVVRGCVLAVQPVAPAGNGNAGAIARVDAAYVLDTESGTWHTKSACTRVAVGRRALGGASRRVGARAANLRLGALAAFSERRRGAS